MNRKLLPLILFIAGFWTTAFGDHLSSNLMFTARLSGSNEVPAVTSDGQGLGIFTFDEKKSTLYFNISLSSLSGPITGMHIHEGAPGENGGVVIDLTSFLNGNRAKGSIRNIERSTLAEMITGDYYLNVHTENHPGGEIRGQVLLETDYRYAARLSGDAEVPAVTTNGKGLFVANLSHSGTNVNFHMVFQGLSSDVTGAHIHNAAAGQNGGVIFDLGPFIFGNVVVGSWDPTVFIDALRAGELYINVHTVNHPGGEIRGQLLLQEGLLFDAILDGDQEQPPTETDGRGIAIITVSPDLSEMEYYVVFDSLSGPVTGAHLHTGIAGASGGVVVDLSDGLAGNELSGTAPLDIDLINRMLEGGIYINIHTDENPGGEIRGQVYKLAREGYMFDMNGGQEVPPVTTTGTGAGIVTIDRDQTNAHFMIVYSGLQGDFSAAHFHNGAPGVNGPVIFSLTDFFNEFGGAYGYWDQNSTPAFDASLLFRENQVYANVHTDMFPGGEIRGNVLRARDLFSELPFDPKFSNDLMLTAEMNGGNENPAVTTNGIGLGTIFFDADRTTAHVNVTVSDLSGPITNAHIHDGITGMNGPVVFPLAWDGTRIQLEIPNITPAQLGKFLNGEYYINIHTAAHPGGEIRGQIILEQDITFVAQLSGNQEVPAVTTDGKGLGAFHYTLFQSTLDVNVQLTELSSEITGVHLHNGAPGENGPVIIDLGSVRDGNRLQGQVDLSFENLLLLAGGEVYINVHTTNNPAGEIRGQLNFQSGLVFDGWMSGLQEVPFATTAGSGYAIATVASDLSNVHVSMVSDAVSGNISASHFHNAPMGSNGGVVLDLSTALNDNDVEFTGAIPDAVVSALLSGNIYINVHTPAFPGGELRGQMFRLARDGYGFDLCPEQEVGTVDAPNAKGSGMLSIDRLHSNVNLSVVTDRLTGPITASHFHEAPVGVSGPVVIDLTSLFANGAFSIVGAETDTAFVNSVRAGNIYLNVHTSMHPAGEIRGQVVKEFLCSIETGIDDLAYLVNEVMLSPNPVVEKLNITMDINSNATLSMKVMDLSGKLISTDQFNVTQGRNEMYVDTESLYPGFYILMISDGNAAQAYKFVK